MPQSDDVLNLIRNLGEKERALPGSEFISPVFYNRSVVTWVRGLVHRLTIPRVDPGWYRIRPVNLDTAEVVGEADLMDIEKYLGYLPKLRLILIQKNKRAFLAIPLKNQSLDIESPLPVLLTSDMVMPFDTVVCGYDGSNIWFKDSDVSVDLSKADYLRDSFEKGIDPGAIRYKGLSIEEKMAYMLRCMIDEDHRELLAKKKVQWDVEHAGGVLVSFEERDDHISVTYKVDDHQYTSYVSKDPSHQVLTAGICLEDRDSDFDLASLVSVIREGQGRDLIHRFHNTE